MRLLINPSFSSVFYKCQKENRVYRQVHLRLWSYHFSNFVTVDGLQVSPFTPKKYCASSRKQEHALWPYGFSRRQTYVPNSETYHGLALSFMGYVRDLTASPWVIFRAISSKLKAPIDKTLLSFSDHLYAEKHSGLFYLKSPNGWLNRSHK